MKDIPQLITVGPLHGMQLEGVSYDPQGMTCEVKAHYALSDLPRWGYTARVYGDIYITGIGQDSDHAIANLLEAIKKLTEATS